QKEAPKIKREPKFRKRKEATTGLLANLHYIHLYKKRGKYTRCVVDVTVNVHGNKYHSTAYSYDFSKYGGKVQAIKIAKNDRNKLAELVHRKAMELNNITPKSYEETKRIIKGVKINKTPPTLERNPDKFVRRSHSNDYWIVAIRKKIWGRYYRVPNKRFYDSDYGGKHKSKIKARKYAENVELTIIEEFEKLRQLNVTDQDEIQSRVDNIARDFKIE
ncbi:MAG: hypothetical protein GWN16_04330, partial [Calditrichae bacterium]|nr:hypothetical protein [Calditrichia bacterium]NIV71868.1 hypothetical protein [Calditrichia bacterium]NIW78720.1 hypothetical protein [Calditrichia bacterium]